MSLPIRVLLLLALNTTVACGSASESKTADPESPIPPYPPGEPTPPTLTYAHLVSEGEWLGDGLTYDLDLTNAAFTAHFDVGSLGSSIHHLAITVVSAPPNAREWWFDFSAPITSPMVPGDYLDAVRWPPYPRTKPGMAIVSGDRGCNSVAGSFTVHSIHVQPDLHVAQVHISFVHYCEGGGPPLRGDISYVAPVQVSPGK